MTDTRAAKVLGVANSIPDQDVCLGREGAEAGGRRLGLDLRPDPPGRAPRDRRRARTSPTSTSATSGRCRKISSVLLKGFEQILVPEMNMGQFKTLLRDQYLVDAQPLTKVSGHPFRIAEIEAAIDRTGRGLMRTRRNAAILRFDETDQRLADGRLLIAIMFLILAEAALMNEMTRSRSPPPRTGRATRRCAGARAAAIMRC